MGGQPGGLAADCWAFGTILWELATWELPYGDQNAYRIIGTVQGSGRHGLAPPDPAALPAGPLVCWLRYAALMEACLAPDTAARPSFDEVVRELR